MPPKGWDATAAVAGRPLIGWQKPVYRFHRRKRGPLDHNGYLYASGRFHRGVPEFGEDNAWPVLYLSSEKHICLGEAVRHVEPQTLAVINDCRLTTYQAHFSCLLDCQCVGALGLTTHDLLEDTDYKAGQTLAAAALADPRGCEGLLVPSATRFVGLNIVYFPLQPCRGSTLVPKAQEDPHLFPGP